MTTTDTDTLDGRSAKRIGNRRRMLLAGVKMIEKGNYRLTPADVARKVSMHRRSFFEIFGTLDAYLGELLIEHGTSIQAQITKDIKEHGKSLARLIVIGK